MEWRNTSTMLPQLLLFAGFAQVMWKVDKSLGWHVLNTRVQPVQFWHIVEHPCWHHLCSRNVKWKDNWWRIQTFQKWLELNTELEFRPLKSKRHLINSYPSKFFLASPWCALSHTTPHRPVVSIMRRTIFGTNYTGDQN